MKPAAVRGDQVGAGRLEGLDQLAELLLLQPPGQPGETDEVGEAHREPAVDHLLVVRGLHDPPGGGRQLTPPHIAQELLQLRKQQLHQRVRDLGAGHARLGRLGEARQEGVDLPLGEPGGGLAGGPRDLHGHRLAQQPRLDESGQPPQRQDVRLGERLGLADVGEAHRPPEAGGELHRDTGRTRGLEGRVAAVGAEDQLFETDRERIVGRLRGVIDLMVGGAVRREGGSSSAPDEMSSTVTCRLLPIPCALPCRSG